MDAREADLIRAAVSGDTDALNVLLHEVDPRLRDSVRIDLKWRSLLEVQDVLQVTYTEAFEHIGHFKYQGPGSFVAWLKRIARNNHADAMRGLRRDKRPDRARALQPATPSETDVVQRLAGNDSTPSHRAARVESSAALDSAIQRLPELYARVVRMCDLGGMSARDAAAAIGCTPGAVHMRLARAHQRLQAILGSASDYLSC